MARRFLQSSLLEEMPGGSARAEGQVARVIAMLGVAERGALETTRSRIVA